MVKNSRELFDRYLVKVVPARGLSIAKCRPGDFAVYRFGGSSAAIAALSIIRAHGVRRFDGVIGAVTGESIGTLPRKRMEFGHARATHIFNVPTLLKTAFIDDGDERASIEDFVDAISQQLALLLEGQFDQPLRALPRPLVLTPVASDTKS